MIKLTDILNEVKGRRILHVYDFDDTLANSEVPVYVKMKDGKTIKLTSHQFAQYKLEPGDFFDFSEFNKLIKSATPIEKYVNELKQSLSNSQIKTTILTARALAYPVKYWLKTVTGTDVYVVAVAGANPELKASWIENQVNKGYKTIKFVDDSQKNLDTVKKRLEKYPDLDLILINPLHD